MAPGDGLKPRFLPFWDWRLIVRAQRLPFGDAGVIREVQGTRVDAHHPGGGGEVAPPDDGVVGRRAGTFLPDGVHHAAQDHPRPSAWLSARKVAFVYLDCVIHSLKLGTKVLFGNQKLKPSK